MAAIYGEPGTFCSHADTASHLEAVIAQYGSTLSAEDIATMRRDAQALANYATQTLVGPGAILLDYRDSRLESVAVEVRHLQTHCEGRLVFTLGAKEVLAQFESANGMPGRFRSVEAAFDNVAISLHCFSTISQGQVRPMSETGPDFQDRAVTVRKEPYFPVNELDQFVTHSFL